ncbi:hypothetical protein E2C01_039094 [Portunus trituberculatus]|uniref:Uncharacterized protein n=1 Tax=Portunus trituberculatus TaxID=210409 RepID=A0A5B7FIY2_PORTR|nr:hypothetical protein [Portunus trituberculatus]
MRIGHTYLTQRYLLTRDPQPYCDNCLVPLTVRHLLVECPSLIELRHRYLYRCRGRDSGVFYLSKVLGPASLAPGYDFLRFLGEVSKNIMARGQTRWSKDLREIIDSAISTTTPVEVAVS